jgi:hypothetical protein
LIKDSWPEYIKNSPNSTGKKLMSKIFDQKFYQRGVQSIVDCISDGGSVRFYWLVAL